MEMYEVGGAVRDELMGLKTKDVDFVVIAPSFDAMKDHLISEGFKIHQERPEFVTIRCGVPKGSPLRERTKDADFVLARKDAPTGDGRRPDFVEPGTLLDDLSRRDFTVNAIARDVISGEIIDPFGGVADIEARILRFVREPEARIREDGLRVLRGFRFMITKGLSVEPSTFAALVSDLATEMLECVSVERISDELEKMLRHDLLYTLETLSHTMPPDMLKAIFRDGLWLTPSLKNR